MEGKTETCLCVSEERAAEIRAALPGREEIDGVATWFKLFGDPTRVRILYALSNEELCVGHIAEILQLSQTAVSHQLRLLRTSKLVKSRKAGKQVYYTLADDHVRTILEQATTHLME